MTEPTAASRPLAVSDDARSVLAAAAPFLVEYYQDWSDYPGWEPLEDDDGNEYRFATVAAARAWIEEHRQAGIAERLAAWEQDQERVREAQRLYEARMSALESVGLGRQPHESEIGTVLYRPRSGYKKPEPEATSRYRVALDAPCCPTCGVRGSGNRSASNNGGTDD